ncbi:MULTISPECIES: HK97 gp10 family phage protein [Paenibacillus]|uniref:HK97 gp10 family phage protein n=1 Tax=Paenibacillus TaxID=44249 RepID=UPI001B04A2B0|nr:MULTISPECIES: HK97 gp10 family phage protein [Paenibacillus]WFB57473.1 HK97 gp10 family phage protein [Paenibacillus sp. BR1-192]GIP02105.1 hypothetical protein J28TS4_05120 [Paenibacillus lautus]
MANISIDRLASEIVKAVSEYNDDVSRSIDKAVDDAADDVLRDTRANAPKRTGDYAKGFKKTNRDSMGTTRRIIWNKKYSRIVHLLEFGHAKVGGGRVAGKPHLRLAYDRIEPQMMEKIRQIIRNGG